jgi:hypothetical protein
MVRVCKRVPLALAQGEAAAVDDSLALAVKVVELVRLAQAQGLALHPALRLREPVAITDALAPVLTLRVPVALPLASAQAQPSLALKQVEQSNVNVVKD